MGKKEAHSIPNTRRVETLSDAGDPDDPARTGGPVIIQLAYQRSGRLTFRHHCYERLAI